MKHLFCRALLALMIGAAAPHAFSDGWGSVLRGGPIEDFKDEDVHMLRDALNKALDAPGDPAPVAWSNPNTGAGGTVQVVGEAKVKNYAECRRVRGSVYSKKRKGYPAEWTACKDASGEWKLLSAG